MTEDTTARSSAAERADETGCLPWAAVAAGAVVVPFLALAALFSFLGAARVAGPEPGHSARRYVVVLLFVVVPLASAWGWRRGRRPLNDPARARGRGLGWSAGFVGWLLSLLIVPTKELWLDATLFLLLTVMTAVFVSACVSRVAHGALRGDPEASQESA
jgi:hypothetical protein